MNSGGSRFQYAYCTKQSQLCTKFFHQYNFVIKYVSNILNKYIVYIKKGYLRNIGGAYSVITTAFISIHNSTTYQGGKYDVNAMIKYFTDGIL